MKYIALVADICDSKKLENRDEVQNNLELACKRINAQSGRLGIVSPLTITLGDEVQALFQYADKLWVSLIELEAALHPVRLRFGIGIGEISTKINRAAAIGMDGPAFHRARDAVESLRKDGKHYRLVGLGEESELVLHALDMMSSLRGSWKGNRLEIFLGALKNRNASEMAVKLGITERAVYKNIREGDFGAILGFLQELSDVINNRMDTINDH